MVTYAAIKPKFIGPTKDLRSGNQEMAASTTNLAIFEQLAQHAKENVIKQTDKKQSTTILHLSLSLAKMEHGSPETGGTIEGTLQVKHDV